MMTVDSVSGANHNNMQAGSAGKNTQIDPVSKNLQNQIAEEQKKLMSLSSDEEETQEEKVRKRQEIRQEISSLNQKLRQRQIEQKKQEKREQTVAVDNRMPEKDEKVDEKTDNRKADTEKEDDSRAELQQGGMQGMVSAETFVKQAYVQGSVARQMAGRVEVLKAEIKQDSAQGADTERKKKELETLEKKAQKAAASQFSTFADADKTIKNAMEKDDKKTENKSGMQKIVIKENEEEQQAFGIMNQKPVRYVVRTS